MTDGKELHWLVRPNTIRWMWRLGLAMLALFVVADLWLVSHPHFAIDGSFGFYGWYGFVTCVAMVLFAKGLGVFLKRKDSYYDDR
jgi:hypothetical protein